MMTENEFDQNTNFLKSLQRDDLYQLFHKIQFEALSPQWTKHLKSIVENFNEKKVTEILGPKSPTVPETNTASVHTEIKSSEAKDILLLQHVMSFIDNPIEVLRLARVYGYKMVIIHDSPKDGSFRYDSLPPIEHFQIRTGLTHKRHGQSEGNPPLLAVLEKHQALGYRLISDTRPVIQYKSLEQKKLAVQLELALDLIEHKFGDCKSNFDEIQTQLRSWYFYPGSDVKISGASRFIVLNGV